MYIVKYLCNEISVILEEVTCIKNEFLKLKRFVNLKRSEMNDLFHYQHLRAFCNFLQYLFSKSLTFSG